MHCWSVIVTFLHTNGVYVASRLLEHRAVFYLSRVLQRRSEDWSKNSVYVCVCGGGVLILDESIS